MTQVFGIELLSDPLSPTLLGAEGVLAGLEGHELHIDGFSASTPIQIKRGLKKLRTAREQNDLLILISGHGDGKFIDLGSGNIRLEQVLNTNPGLFKNTWLHLSYCQSLSISKRYRKQIINNFSLLGLSGYRILPTWMMSYDADIQFVQSFIDKCELNQRKNFSD